MNHAFHHLGTPITDTKHRLIDLFAKVSTKEDTFVYS